MSLNLKLLFSLHCTKSECAFNPLHKKFEILLSLVHCMCIVTCKYLKCLEVHVSIVGHVFEAYCLF